MTNESQPLETQILPAASANQVACEIQAEPARQLVNLKDIPVVVATSEASYHAPYDDCTVQFLQQAGVNTTHVRYADYGIHGNGHMHFLEKNNLEIAGLLGGFLESME